MARRSPYSILAATTVVILLLLFAYSLASILLLLFISVLFGLFLGAVADYLERRFRVPRWAGLPLAILLTLLGMTSVGLLIIPPVLAQTSELISAMPALLAQWESQLFALAGEYPLLGRMLPPRDSGSYFDATLERMGLYFTGLFPYVFSGIHVLIDFISVLVMGIYLAAQPAMYRKGVIALVPVVHRPLAQDILDDLRTTLRAWIVGQMLAMVFLGVLTWIGLVLLDVPYAMAFAVFTGVVVVVPFFGTLISTLLPALFVLGSAGPLAALLVVLLGVVVHLAEANIVHPLIMQRQVHVPPVLSILSVLIMAELLGVIGLLVAVPVLATVLVLVRRIYVQRLAVGKGFRRRSREGASPVVSLQSSVSSLPGADLEAPAQPLKLED
ncbi:MAG: AI-2E family transporter [Gemmatimonadetes bacterium]|nr:AI-2E family transporter [Gemmatimonadota bacterium]